MKLSKTREKIVKHFLQDKREAEAVFRVKDWFGCDTETAKMIVKTIKDK